MDTKFIEADVLAAKRRISFEPTNVLFEQYGRRHQEAINKLLSAKSPDKMWRETVLLAIYRAKLAVTNEARCTYPTLADKSKYALIKLVLDSVQNWTEDVNNSFRDVKDAYKTLMSFCN